MLRIPRPRVRKPAAIVAGIGGVSGLLYSIIYCALRAGSFRGFVSVAAILVPFGAFLGWWTWLFWLALKVDKFMRYLAVAGFLALVALIFTLQRSNLHLAQRFHQEGLSTQAIVTGLFPSDHNRIGYSYAVDGIPYQGRDLAPGLASDFRVGDPIRIHYLRSAPSVSVSRYPTDTTGSVLGASLLGACWLISGLVNLLYLRRRSDRFLPHWMPRMRPGGGT